MGLPDDYTLPENYNEAYHLGLMLSQSFVNTLAYTLRQSGIFCAALGSDPGGLLTTGDFVPTAGLLYLLAPPLTKLAPPSAPIPVPRMMPTSGGVLKCSRTAAAARSMASSVWGESCDAGM